MRLGLVLYGSLEIITGGFLYDRILVEYLRRQGDEVEVISIPWHGYGRGLLVNFSATWLRRLSRASFDVLLQDELAHPSLFRLNRRLKRLRPYPLVSIVHLLRATEERPAWQNRLYREVERRYLDSVDGFVFTTRQVGHLVEGLVGRGRPAVLAYPAGNRFSRSLTPAEIAARAQRPGPLQVLFLANLIPRKGLHALLEALAALPRESWRLTVAGNLAMAPAYVQAIRRQINRLGLAEKVTLRGLLVGEALAACLARSHLLAVPSYMEGLPLAFLEGLGFGLPVIAGAGGGTGEVITHGQEGFLVKPGDTAALTLYLNRFLENREQLAEMSLAAQARYEAHPTWDQTCAQVRRFLQDVLRGGDRGL
ncbi:MAG: glycosyltransferase family 4 protein [Thermodesulfobacteriota bacterium]